MDKLNTKKSSFGNIIESSILTAQSLVAVNSTLENMEHYMNSIGQKLIK
jgi:hypothetical protein